jgi:hypothetical protein
VSLINVQALTEPAAASSAACRWFSGGQARLPDGESIGTPGAFAILLA